MSSGPVDRRAILKYTEELEQAEAQSRRDESVALNLTRRVVRGENAEGLRQQMDAAIEAARVSGEALRDLRAQGLPRQDLEGTAPTLADIYGNVAPNAQVAGAGGTGIDGSNSNQDGSAQAQTAEEAVEGVVPSAGPTLAYGVGGRAVEQPEQGDPNEQLPDAAPSFEQVAQVEQTRTTRRRKKQDEAVQAVEEQPSEAQPVADPTPPTEQPPAPEEGVPEGEEESTQAQPLNRV